MAAPDTIIVPPIPDEPKLQERRALAGITKQPDAEVRSMLSSLNADMGYNDWLKIGMALHAGGYPLALWDEWSEGGSKYEPGICHAKWDSFTASGSGMVTMGTVVHMAQAAGWTRSTSAADATAEPVQFIEPATLQNKPIPEREWLVPDWIPTPYTTALYGDGGTGKSLLAMQLMTTAAIGKNWLGQPVKPVKALGFFCEDTESELHYRQAQINQAYGCTFTDLQNMTWYSGVGKDNTLVTFDSGHGANLTALYEQLEKKTLDFGAQLVVIDTAADTFGGNENARRDVRMFISQLNKLALKINGAVVLCAHPSVAGMVSGRGDGGNTAWNNSVRSRLYLHRSAADKDALPGDANIRLLSRMKSNYSAANDELTLLWQNGVFITLGATGGPGDALTKVHRDTLAEESFLKAMDDIAAQGRKLSSAKTSGNYAPKMLMKNARCNGFNKKELEAAMERLFSKRQIKDAEYGRGSRPARYIVKTGVTNACNGIA